MTKSKITILFEIERKICSAWCVDMLNPQPISVRIVKSKPRNTTVKCANFGIMTARRAYTTAVIVASVV